jgi:hypothetical protein
MSPVEIAGCIRQALYEKAVARDSVVGEPRNCCADSKEL